MGLLWKNCAVDMFFPLSGLLYHNLACYCSCQRKTAFKAKKSLHQKLFRHLVDSDVSHLVCFFCNVCQSSLLFFGSCQCLSDASDPCFPLMKMSWDIFKVPIHICWNWLTVGGIATTKAFKSFVIIYFCIHSSQMFTTTELFPKIHWLEYT